MEGPLLRWYRWRGAYSLYLVSFVLSVVSCSGMGLLTLFSIFAKHLDTVLGMSVGEINMVIVVQVLGMNLCTPLSGYVADAWAVWILPLAAMGGYLFSFGVLLLAVEVDIHRGWIYAAFFVMGGSHVTFLFSCLLNSARSFGRYYQTLAISTPNLMTAFSSYVQIKVIGDYFSGGAPRDNFRGILTFFLGTLLLCTVLSLGGGLITRATDKLEGDAEQFESYETSPLLSGAATVLHTPLGSPRSWYTDQSTASSITEEFALDPGQGYHRKVLDFLRDPYMYVLMGSCVASMSASEFFVANLNSILDNLGVGEELDRSLQVFSVAATCTRFVIMMATDVVATRFGVSRISMFTTVVIATGVSYLYLSSRPVAAVNTVVMLVANAMLNSTVFTLFPAILAAVYGMDILGTTWGIFCSSSIVGNVVFNGMYSLDFGTHCSGSSSASASVQSLTICSTTTFFVGGLILIVSGALMRFSQHVYLQRANEFF